MSAQRSPKWPRTIGILGGLGPFAHIAFEMHLLDAAARHLGGALRDQDLPPWVLASLPQTPDRTEAMVHGGPSPVPALIDGLRLLVAADFAVVVCNTAHRYIEEIRAGTGMPILDMVTETLRQIAVSSGPRPVVGLLATRGTVECRVYEEAASSVSRDLVVVTPPRADDVMEVVYGTGRPSDPWRGGIKGGAHRDPAIRGRMEERLHTVVGGLVKQGAERVVLGCTELPLVMRGDAFAGIPLVDPMRAAADAAIAIAAGLRPLPEGAGCIA